MQVHRSGSQHATQLLLRTLSADMPLTDGLLIVGGARQMSPPPGTRPCPASATASLNPRASIDTRTDCTQSTGHAHKPYWQMTYSVTYYRVPCSNACVR